MNFRMVEADRRRWDHFVDQLPIHIPFSQSYEMGEVYSAAGKPFQRLLLLSGGEVQAALVLRRYVRKRLFNEWWVTHGPLCDYRDPERTAAVMKALDRELVVPRTWAIQMCLPPTEEEAPYVPQMMAGLGYRRIDGEEPDPFQINLQYVKDLSGFADEDALLHSLEGRVRRAYQAASQMESIEIRDVFETDFDSFYDLIARTKERKNGVFPEADFLRAIRKGFQERARAMALILDPRKMKAELEERLATEEQVLLELKSRPHPRLPRIEEQESVISALARRMEELTPFENEPSPLCLAGLFTIDTKTERITFNGGRRTELSWLSPTAVLNTFLLLEARKQGFTRYNFYGVMELDQAGQGQGNYEFKRGFAGEVRRLVGIYRKERSFPFLPMR